MSRTSARLRAVLVRATQGGSSDAQGPVGFALLAVVAAACAPETSTSTSATDASGSSSVDACAVDNLNLYVDGTLTIATGNPAY